MKLNEVLKDIGNLIQQLEFGPMEPRVGKDVSLVLFTRGNVTITLTGKDADAYTGYTDRLYEAVSGDEAISKSAVSNLLAETFAKLFAEGDRRGRPEFGSLLEAEIRGIKEQLTAKPLSWELYFRVGGLAHSELPFTVGRVEFLFGNAETLAEIEQRARDILAPNRDVEPESKTQFLDAASGNLKRSFDNKPLAKLRIEAIDLEAARSLALKVLRGTVDAINFFADRERYRMWVYLPGEGEPSTELSLAFILGEKPQFTFKLSRVGPFRTLPIRQISRRPGFERVSRMLLEAKPDTLSSRILTALQWAGRARVGERPEEAFLLYAISLETLMLGTGQDIEIGYRLGLRCVHLLAGRDLESRRLVQKQIRALYRTRSKIVHSGVFQVSQVDLALISEYSRVALFIVLDRKPFGDMKSEEELETWFETQSLGAEIDKS